MASLKDIKRRIAAATNTQKVIRAMKLVASTRIKRAQLRAQSARSYAAGLHEAVGRVSRRLGPRAPVMWRRPQRIESLDILVITSDRGFCGGFNENLLRLLEEGVEEHLIHNIEATFYVVGRQGARYLTERGYDVDVVPTAGGSRVITSWVVSQMIGRYYEGLSAGGYVVFNRFVSAAHQEVTFWNLLPMYRHGTEQERHMEFLYEPSRDAVLDYLCVEALISTIHQALLESQASELAARLSAMDAANRNAEEMIAHLKSVYNKRRQEEITSELLDVIGGAEVLLH